MRNLLRRTGSVSVPAGGTATLLVESHVISFETTFARIVFQSGGGTWNDSDGTGHLTAVNSVLSANLYDAFGNQLLALTFDQSPPNQIISANAGVGLAMRTEWTLWRDMVPLGAKFPSQVAGMSLLIQGDFSNNDVSAHVVLGFVTGVMVQES